MGKLVRGIKPLCGREEFLEAYRQSVELVVSGIITKMPELTCPQHAPVPLRHMVCQRVVKEDSHNESHNHWWWKEDIEYVIELHRTTNITQLSVPEIVVPVELPFHSEEFSIGCHAYQIHIWTYSLNLNEELTMIMPVSFQHILTLQNCCSFKPSTVPPHSAGFVCKTSLKLKIQ